jgi:2-keto-3-deoxy-L-rhamnonate aldolase RhmA
MGKMGRVDDPEVVSAIDRVIQSCRAAGVAVGWFAVTADAARPYVDRGCTFITAGVDTLLLAGAARQTLQTLQGHTAVR